MANSTPHGLLTYASEFRKAALAADEKLGHRPGFELIAPVPVMYMIGHSIELSFKSFLLFHGRSDNQLRSIGHDLQKAMRKCKELGFRAALDATPEEVASLRALNVLYESKQLNYSEAGLKEYPVFGYIESLSKKLLLGAGEDVGYPMQLLA
jgi:hypothetical protein